jgi:hypothetical protein
LEGSKQGWCTIGADIVNYLKEGDVKRNSRSSLLYPDSHCLPIMRYFMVSDAFYWQ